MTEEEITTAVRVIRYVTSIYDSVTSSCLGGTKHLSSGIGEEQVDRRCVLRIPV